MKPPLLSARLRASAYLICKGLLKAACPLLTGLCLRAFSPYSSLALYGSSAGIALGTVSKAKVNCTTARITVLAAAILAACAPLWAAPHAAASIVFSAGIVVGILFDSCFRNRKQNTKKQRPDIVFGYVPN